MSDKKITQLTASTTPLDGTEVLPVVQSGSTKKVAVSDLTAGRNVAMASAVTPIINNSGTIKLQVNSVDQMLLNGTDGNLAIGGSLIPYNKLELGTTGANNSVGIGMRARNASNSDSPATSIITSYDSTGGAVGAKLEISTRDGSGVLTGLTVKPNRNVEINLGNLVIGTSGKGIDFSADGSAAGMTSELFDDYEEGTWTPALAIGSGSITGYTTQIGTYTKIGRLVTLSVNIKIATVSLPGSYVVINNLPFSPASTSGAVSVYANALAAGAVDVIQGQIRTSDIYLTQYSAGATNNIGDYLQANTEIQLTATYEV